MPAFSCQLRVSVRVVARVAHELRAMFSKVVVAAGHVRHGFNLSEQLRLVVKTEERTDCCAITLEETGVELQFLREDGLLERTLDLLSLLPESFGHLL